MKMRAGGGFKEAHAPLRAGAPARATFVTKNYAISKPELVLLAQSRSAPSRRITLCRNVSHTTRKEKRASRKGHVEVATIRSGPSAVGAAGLGTMLGAAARFGAVADA